MDDPSQRCDEENPTVDVTRCITRYLEQRLGCRHGHIHIAAFLDIKANSYTVHRTPLIGNNPKLAPCNTTEQVNLYLDLTEELQEKIQLGGVL